MLWEKAPNSKSHFMGEGDRSDHVKNHPEGTSDRLTKGGWSNGPIDQASQAKQRRSRGKTEAKKRRTQDETMFAYFLKGVSRCQDRADVVHLSKKLLQNMHLLDTKEISLCLNKLSKAPFEDKAFWENVCRVITTTDVGVLRKFKCLRGVQQGGDAATAAVREETVGNASDGEAHRGDPHCANTPRKDKLLYHFTMEELCLVLNALAKVNVRNDEILKLASQKIMREFQMNRHLVNTIKAIGSFGVATPASSHGGGSHEGGWDPMGQALHNVCHNYDRVSRNLTERDISVLIRVLLTRGGHVSGGHVRGSHVGGNQFGSSQAGGNRSGEEASRTAGALIERLISSVKKINHISEQSIALILNACTKSSVKNKSLLDILKIIIILKLKKDKNKCSDIFVSSVTHSYSSFAYRDRVLYNAIAEYVCANLDGVNVKALVIILNSYVNVGIINVRLFNAALGKLARREVVNGLSNQCTSNVVTVVTKAYRYLCEEKARFLLGLVKARLRREFARTGGSGTEEGGKGKRGTGESATPHYATPRSPTQPRRSAFLEGFLTKHLTNLLNNLSKLNHADANLFALFSHLILKKENEKEKEKGNEINKLDFLNITSAYARFGYVHPGIYQLIRRHAKRHLEDPNLKYVEFINMFTSLATFSLMEGNGKIERWEDRCSGDYRSGDRWRGAPPGQFSQIIRAMMELLRGGANRQGSPPGDEAANGGIHLNGAGANCPHPEHHARIYSRRNIIDNLSAKHTCCILATMSKLGTHDWQIYEQCLRNIKKKIFKMDSRSLTMYLLYVSKFGLTPDRYIRALLSSSFKVVHLQRGKTSVPDAGEDQRDLLGKMSTLCTQLQTEDLVNAVYIVRSLIKNDPHYRGSAYVMCAYLEGIYSGVQGTSGGVAGGVSPSGVQSSTPRGTPYKREADQNIIHIGEAQADDPTVAALLSGRKLNTQTACILMNTLAFINTHIRLPSGRYAKIVSYLLLFSLRFLVDRLNLRRPLRELLYEGTPQRESMQLSDDQSASQKERDIKSVVRGKIDSASIRQINMTILMIFHLGSLNPFCYSPQWEVTNLASYPLRLLQYVLFFLKFSPLAPFERYTSVYNSVGNRRKLTNYCGEQKLTSVQVHVEGVKKVKGEKLNFLFEGIKKSETLEGLFLQISKCNEQIHRLNVFAGAPLINLRSLTETDVEVKYTLRERTNSYAIGTNVNNRGEVTADLEMNLPYVLKTINSLQLKANVSSLYTNNFALRLVIPQVSSLANFNLIFEGDLSNVSNTQQGSYTVKSNSLRTFLVGRRHTLIWDVNFNTLFQRISRGYIPSESLLKLPGRYVKHTLRHVYTWDALFYGWPREAAPPPHEEAPNQHTDDGRDNPFHPVEHTNYPTEGHFYQMESELSLPFCEAKFFKNHLHYLFVKRLRKNVLTYVSFTNGVKHDFDKAAPYQLGAFHFSGSIGSSLTFRGFEHNSIGHADQGYKFDRKKGDYQICYNYLGANFITSFQFLLKYICKLQSVNPILFFYVQVGRLGNHLFPSFDQLRRDMRVSTGVGLMAYIQKNVSLEVFFNFPLLRHWNDRTRCFQVGLSFRGML
ncbi:hypothetical protein PVBG_01268 [Plasmodium vivax Brazil I]|uniref:Uncharacterized protein n=1 Tax=Plasmodium vivax (strain Brazil I) TaxID=1033975 RepID=A0A0J9VGI3_PLAV1|nr:hypothetical protein PVBG_01268 [Plasmodium vivax Brazil I]